MTLQTTDACGAGPAKIVVSFDDTTPFLIRTYQLIDETGAPGTMTATISGPVIGTIIAPINVNGGTQAPVDISGLGLTMIQLPKKYPTSAPNFRLPFAVTCAWSGA